MRTTAPKAPNAPKDQLEDLAERAEEASSAWAATSPRERASALVAAANALMAEAPSLVATAMRETGLSEPRLTGELKRTAVQLRLFADVVVDGAYLEVRIDEPDPDFVLGVRPDVRRYRVPLGPVLNFAAGNFPFAFSVAGGDTAAALAAGCAVVVKAHPGHPLLSDQLGRIVSEALEGAGAPERVLQVVHGQQAGIDLLNHPRIKAASFTGSVRVGQMLAEIAAARPVPIPFYGELGSVNPVFVTAAALAAGTETLLDGFVASVAGSAGQLCTKPGFLFVPGTADLDAGLAARAAGVAEHRMLNPGIAEGYRRRRDTILHTDGVTVVAEGGLRFDDEGQGWATPTIVRVSTEVLLAQRERLLDEAFGPLSILVGYDDEGALGAIATDLFGGNLTGTVHLGPGEDGPWLRALIERLSGGSGRVLFGGWPTGVAVTHAMQHGGPWPATTLDTSTSVGTAAISRFTRPVAFQNAPQEMLPMPLRDDNPWAVPQRRDRAGRSHDWGAAAGLRDHT